MATAYPGALDTTGSQQRTDISSTTDMDASGQEHDVMHVNHAGAIVALETKLGLTDSNAAANAILVGSGASTTSWTTSPTVSGVLTASTGIVAPLVVVNEDNSHSFAAADAGKMFTFSGSSGATTVTLPQDSATTFAIGTQIVWVRLHASIAVTFAAGTGATVNSKDSNLSIDGQYAVAVTVKRAANTWLIFGALA